MKTDELTRAFEDFHKSRPQHPYNITDVFTIVVGWTENKLELAIRASETDDERSDYENRLAQLNAAWSAFQSGTQILLSEDHAR